MQLRGNDRERLPASTGRRDRQGTGSASELPGAPRHRLLAQTSVVSATSVRTFLAAARGQHRAVTRPTTACPRGPPAQRADGHAGRCRRLSSPLPRLDPGAGGQSCLPKSRLGDAEPLLDTLSTCGFHAPGTRWHVPPCPLPVMPTRARTRASVPGNVPSKPPGPKPPLMSPGSHSPMGSTRVQLDLAAGHTIPLWLWLPQMGGVGRPPGGPGPSEVGSRVEAVTMETTWLLETAGGVSHPHSPRPGLPQCPVLWDGRFSVEAAPASVGTRQSQG